MLIRDEDHVETGWDVDHNLRWIEAGRLRLEEDKEGAGVTIQETAGPTWLSATELAGLARHLTGWFMDDPAETIGQVEAAVAHVRTELEAWDARARIDEEHPPYSKLVGMLDDAIRMCKRFREEGLFGASSEGTR